MIEWFLLIGFLGSFFLVLPVCVTMVYLARHKARPRGFEVLPPR